MEAKIEELQAKRRRITKSVPPKPFAAEMPAINKSPIGLDENELLAVIAFVESIAGELKVDPSMLKVPSPVKRVEPIIRKTYF